MELVVEIAATPEAVFAALTDLGRMPRWLPNTEAIEKASGPIGETGTTFIQRAGPGLRRPGSTVVANPPRLWHVRVGGLGETVDAIFRVEDRASSARVRVELRIQTGPAILAPIMDRLGSRIDRRIWQRALAKLKAEVERLPADMHAGTVYSLDTRSGIFRLAQVLAADEQHVHLRVYAQHFRHRPRREELTELKLTRPAHYGEIQPLTPTLRGAATPGAPIAWLLADGGHGLGHAPVARGVLASLGPEPLFDASVADDLLAPVAAWRARHGRAFGEAGEPEVGASFSVALEGGGFGVVKLLRSEFIGVHVRLYGRVFDERPTTFDEMLLGPPGVDHLALTHPAFARWQPEYLGMTLVDREELDGYEAWKRARGEFADRA